jgi:signal transduction histidine kinase
VRHSSLKHDLLAGIGLAALALAVRALLDPLLGNLLPYLFDMFATVIAVMLLSLRAGIATAIVSYPAALYFFVEPRKNYSLGTKVDVTILAVNLIVIAILIFIAHRARSAEQKLLDANGALHQIGRQKDAFLATLGHEVRDPLSAIRNASGVLQAIDIDSELGRQAVAMIVRQVQHLGRLADELLDVSRIASGRISLRREATDLRVPIENALDGISAQIGERHQSLTLSLPAGPVTALVDPARIMQVLTNLIVNASKYCPEGAEIWIELSEASPATITVTDNGPGIPPALLPHVFQRLESRPPDALPQGLGIGLPLCAHLVDLHGGEIAAENVPNGGARFTIRLPTGASPKSSSIAVSVAGTPNAQ